MNTTDKLDAVWGWPVGVKCHRIISLLFLHLVACAQYDVFLFALFAGQVQRDFINLQLRRGHLFSHLFDAEGCYYGNGLHTREAKKQYRGEET